MMHELLRGLLSSLVYSALGIVLFAFAIAVVNQVVPFSLRKEIEEDQNTALALMISSVIVGLALIVSAAIHG